MSADDRVAIHLLKLKCGPHLYNDSSTEEIKLAERMASILKDFEESQLEFDKQLDVVKEEEEDWDPQDELMDVERQACSGHMITFSGGTLVSEERMTVGKLSRVGLRQSFRWNKICYYCVVVSYLATFDSLTIFSLNVKTYGVLWLISYIVCMMLVGFPLLYLEVALGQYVQASALTIFDRIAPICVGIGASSVITLLLYGLVDYLRLVTMFVTTFNSIHIFADKLPWDDCVHEESDEGCKSLKQKCSIDEAVHSSSTDLNTLLNAQSYLGDTCIRTGTRTVHSTLQLENNWLMSLPHMEYFMSGVKLPYANAQFPPITGLFCSLIAFTLAVFILGYHREWVIHLAVVNCFFLIVGVIMLFVILLHLQPPFYPATEALTSNSQEQALTFDAWIAAVMTTCMILKLGHGGMIFIGSQNSFHNNLLQDSMVIILLMSLIPFLYMLVNRLAVDSFLLELVDGNYLAFLEKYRENLITSRKRERAVTTLVSLFLSSSLTVDELHPIFTLCISLFGSFSIFTAKLIRLEIITFSFFEYFGLFLNHPSKSHFLVAVVGLTALISHCFVYLEGFVLLAGLESNVMPALCVALVLAELVAVCYIYGSTRFFSNVQTMAMSKLGFLKSILLPQGESLLNIELLINMLTLALWTAVIPILIFIALLNFVFGDAWDFDRGDRLMLIVVLLPIPICALYRIHQCVVSRIDIRRLFIPNPELWGPRSRNDQILAAKGEKLFRI